MYKTCWTNMPLHEVCDGSKIDVYYWAKQKLFPVDSILHSYSRDHSPTYNPSIILPTCFSFIIPHWSTPAFLSETSIPEGDVKRYQVSRR